MSDNEIKQNLINEYANRLRIKKAQPEGVTNTELETQMIMLRVQLNSYSVDISQLEKAILGT